MASLTPKEFTTVLNDGRFYAGAKCQCGNPACKPVVNSMAVDCADGKRYFINREIVSRDAEDKAIFGFIAGKEMKARVKATA